MHKKLSRSDFLKLMAVAPAALAMPMVKEQGFPVEVQIEDTKPFRLVKPDGFYGACPEPDGSRFILHYVRDGVEHLNYHRYGFWTEGESGIARVVVTDKKGPCVETNLIIGE